MIFFITKFCQMTCLSLYRTMTSFYKYRTGILNLSLVLKAKLWNSIPAHNIIINYVIWDYSVFPKMDM